RHSDELAILDVEGFPMRRSWYLAYPKDKILSVVAHAFLDFMHAESKAHSDKYLQGIVGFPNSAPEI
ncbi:MAG: LysR family transcriptional regulator, partial [Gallionella sp.]